MKKYLVTILLGLFILPYNVMAYSNYIIPGGETLGISIKSDGVLVIGFYKINGKYNKTDLKVGDYIIKVENEQVNTIEELTNLVSKYKNKKDINISYRRNNKTLNGKINLVYDQDIYKTGLYVKDSVVGCGTLSYIDPITRIYGALGHEIIDSNSNEIIEIKTGDIFENKITSITKSYDGTPGSKNSTFNFDNIYGDVKRNTKMGIYGMYTEKIPDKQPLKVGTKDDIKIGPAYIYTVLENEKVESFEIEITSIDELSKTKNMTFNIVDNNLIERTGGVIQGMSGSPIIQGSYIIGAVTHVKVDDVKSGYAIFITTMLEEGEK